MESMPTDAASSLAQANQLGDQGYAYVGPLAALGSGGGVEYGNLYFQAADRTGSRLRYEADASATSVAQHVAALNARGQQGWAYKTDMAYGNTDFRALFVRDTTRPATYAYVADAAAGNWTAELAQWNGRGAQGYRFIGPIIFGVAGGASNLYGKASAPTGTYSYTTQAMPGANVTAAEFEALLDSMGAQRQVFYSGYHNSAENTSRLLFETSTLQTQALDYAVESTTAMTSVSLSQGLTRVNAKAAQGYVYVGDYAFSATNMVSIYVKGQTYGQQMPLGGVIYP